MISKKTGIIIAVVIFIIMDILIVAYYFYNKPKEDGFKYYNELDITNNISNISPEKYVDDSYLISFVMLDNYNGVINSNNVEKIAYYYMTTITKSSSRKFKSNESDSGFCLSESAFNDSVMELFNIDATNIYGISNIPSYMSFDNDKVCFEYSAADLSDYAYFIGIDDISVNNDIINAKLYLYSIDAEDREEEEMFKKNLVSSIKNKSLEDFNYYLSQSESSYATIEEKNVSFKEIPNGEYFKYQLISINTK